MKTTQFNINTSKHVPHFIVVNARNSHLSLLPVKFVFVELQVIGTHELVNNVRKDQVDLVLNSLLKSGYAGPAISVIEKGRDTIYDSIIANKTPLLDTISYGQLGIADGHNRLAALKILQARKLLNYQYIPVQIILARKPNIVSLRVTNTDETPLTIEQIESCFTDPNLTIDPKSTTHFESAFRDGQWRRVREGQPDIVISREDLIDNAMISK